MATSKAEKQVEIENVTRSVFRLPIYGENKVIVDRVILGDRDDGSRLQPGEPGHPKQFVDADQFGALKSQHGAFLRGLRDRGDIVVRGASL